MFQNHNELTTSFLEANYKNLYTELTTTNKYERPRPSSSLCPRQITLGMSVTTTFKQMKCLQDYATIGNAIETTVLNKYREQGQLYLSQWRIHDSLLRLGLNMGGIVDAFLKINDKLILIDIKSVGSVENHSSFPLSSEEVNLIASGVSFTISPDDERVKQTTGKLVKESNLAQLQLYAAITGFDEVFIQYMSRKVQDGYTIDGTPSVKFEKVPVNNSALENRVAVVYYSQLCLENGLIPDKLKGIKKTSCGDAFCPFIAHCWKDEPIETDLGQITPEKSSELKKIALGAATEYIAKRHERYQLTLELIEAERNARLKKRVTL